MSRLLKQGPLQVRSPVGPSRTIQQKTTAARTHRCSRRHAWCQKKASSPATMTLRVRLFTPTAMMTATETMWPEAARAQWRKVADQARPRIPKLATLMDDAEADVVAYPLPHQM